MKSILQDWVMNLGLRYQGVLISAVRGCDSVPKEDATKSLIRCYRAAVLNAHAGDAKKAKTFIEHVEPSQLFARMMMVVRAHDHYPVHYANHLIHAAEIVGYFHPEKDVRDAWFSFYANMCRKYHMTCETRPELAKRLEANEDEFYAAQ